VLYSATNQPRINKKVLAEIANNGLTGEITMNKKSIKALCLSVLPVLFMTTAQAETLCVGEFNQDRVDTDLIVPEGSTCTITVGVSIFGNLIVEAGGTLETEISGFNPLTIYGSLRSYEASYITLGEAKVFGDVILNGTSKNGISGRGVALSNLTVIGDIEIYGYEITIDDIRAVRVDFSHIGGNLRVESNTVRNINLRDNRVGKDIIVKRNDALVVIQVEGNTAGNSIVCKGNLVVPTNDEDSRPNFAPKGVEGQCADLI
jgi:hypothetical protein